MCWEAGEPSAQRAGLRLLRRSGKAASTRENELDSERTSGCCAADFAAAGHDCFQKGVRFERLVAGDFGPGLSDIEEAVVVGAAGADLLPDTGPEGLEPVLVHELQDRGRTERSKVGLEHAAVQAAMGAPA